MNSNDPSELLDLERGVGLPHADPKSLGEGAATRPPGEERKVEVLADVG